MSQTTDTPEFARGFLWQIVVLSIVALGLVFVSTKWFPPDKYKVEASTAMLPWVVAGGQTISNGLAHFSGEQPVVRAETKTKAIVGLVLFVLGPTVVLLGLRRRSIGEGFSHRDQPWRISHVLFGLCAAFVLIFSCAIPYMAVRGEEVRQSLREAQAHQTSRDWIINEINMISVDVAQFFSLPKDLGGGNRSLLGYQLNPKFIETAEATYAARSEAGKVHVRAVSRHYVDSWVEVAIDSTGRDWGWTYGGKFR